MTRTIIWSSPADPRDPHTPGGVADPPTIELEHRDDERGEDDLGVTIDTAVDEERADDTDDVDIESDDVETGDRDRPRNETALSDGVPHLLTFQEVMGAVMCLIAVILAPAFVLLLSSHKPVPFVPKETSPPVVAPTTPATTPHPARVVKPKRAKPVVVPTTVAAPVVQAPPPTQPQLTEQPRTQTPVTAAPVAQPAPTPVTAPPPAGINVPYTPSPGISVPYQPPAG